MKNDKIILYNTSLVRLVSSWFIIYQTKVPLHFKIIIVILLDLLDCSFLHHQLNLYQNNYFCHNEPYLTTDKITDIIVEMMILYYISTNSSFDKKILLFLFIFRLIGLFMYVKTKNERFLFYFPNFVIWYIIYISIVENTSLLKTNKQKKITLSLLIIIKIIQEFYLHYDSAFTNKLKKFFAKTFNS